MRKFLTKKKIIWTVIILAIAGFIIWRARAGRNSAAGIQTDTVKRQDLTETVLATGQVVSGTDLELGFKSGGIIRKVNVQAGGQVKAGDVLAALDQGSQAASLTQAEGALAQAKANYDKVLAGSSSQDIAVAQAAVDAAQVALSNAQQTLANTKQQQAVLVSNAYGALLNSTLAAVPGAGNISSANPTITGTYTGTDQGVYTISIYATGSGYKFSVSGLEQGSGDVKTSPVPLGTRGLYVQWPSTTVGGNDQWTVAIPNTQASNYITNYNSYQAALQTQTTTVATAQAAVGSAQVALTQAQAALGLKQAQARPADIAAAQAQILTAQGQVQAAQAALEDTVIRAPVDGTVTEVDAKVGQQASPSTQMVVLQDVNDLHIEADVSEANIASIQTGQSVDVTFDALGPDRHFNATVTTINPASTVISGVVDYLVKASLPKVSEIKPGMTANMTILVAKKSGVLAVPQRAVLSGADGKQSVRVITDDKTKTYKAVPVTTGLQADGGLVEITGGLSEGQEIVTYIKQ